MPTKTCSKCGNTYETRVEYGDEPKPLCTPCWRLDRNEARRRAEAEAERLDYGGVLGADGQVHSDADPGL